MVLSLNFVVGHHLRDSRHKKTIALDPIAMELLGIEENDSVYAIKGEVFGIPLGKEVELTAIRALPEDIGKKVVRLSSDVTEFRLGESIIVYVK